MIIDESRVRRIAHLSRLSLQDSEVAVFARQLERILEYVRQIEQVDVSGVEPLAHALPLTDVLREDAPRASFSSDVSLANAPQRERDFFRVPAVLDPNAGA